MKLITRKFLLASTLGLGACGGACWAQVPTNRTILGVLVTTPTRPTQRSVQDVQNALFSSAAPSVRSFYWVVSGGRLNITNHALVPAGAPIPLGDIVNVVIPEPTGDDCATATWSAPAVAAAAAAGFDPATYDTTYIVTPRVAVGCANATGTQGTVGATNTNRKVVYFDMATTPATSPLTIRTLVHELGHNIGAGHARALTCTDPLLQLVPVSMSGNCIADTQGDSTDGMGTTGRVVDPGPLGNPYSAMDPNPRLFAAPRAYDFGWVLPSEVTTVTGPGYYRLRPLYCSADNGAPRALRMASTTAGKDYWLETRVACGGPYDNFVNGSIHHLVLETTVHGLLIRQANSSPATQPRETWLLDLHPLTTNSSSSRVDAALSPGEIFTDPLPGGMRFQITSVDPDGTIQVHIW
ncbi:hypothetical protein ACFJIX_01690 [Roseateles sp. UC29_93]|uniref:hypothetical protein n=1 Tax=Roseateles sp. UC29_93 TaxID=3350177 RepID=UPI00366FF0F7